MPQVSRGLTRRGLFGLIAAGVAAALDPEQMLWTPGAKLIPRPRAIRLPWIEFEADTSGRMMRVDVDIDGIKHALGMVASNFGRTRFAMTLPEDVRGRVATLSFRGTDQAIRLFAADIFLPHDSYSFEGNLRR